MSDKARSLPFGRRNDNKPSLLGSEQSSGSFVLPPLSGIVELLVLTGLIIAVDAMLPDIDLSDMQPNPFWLPVLLLSLQYGTVSGLLAAGMALLVTVLTGLPEAGVGENHFSYALRVFLQPILWFAAAVLLGQFRMRQITAKHGLRDMVIDLEQQRTALANYAQGLRERCARLERDSASVGEAPGVTLLAQLANLGAGKGSLDADFSALMATAFPGAKASLMAFGPTSAMTQIASVGWDAGAPWSRELAIADPLYRAVVGEGRTVSLLVPGDENRLAKEGVAAVPVLGADGAIVGMLKVEQADPAQLTDALVPALRLIAGSLAQRIVASPAMSAEATQQPTSDAEISAPRHLRSVPWRKPGTAAGDGKAADDVALILPKPYGTSS